MAEPKISILVPCFNVSKWLEACLGTVLKQTEKNVEVICIDDGSTDETPKILDEIASQDSRIHIISKRNTGYGDSMNQALELATGEYIGIVEPDDWIELNMFEKLLSIAKKTNADVVRCRYKKHWVKSDREEESPFFNYTNQVASWKINDKLFELTPAIWSAVYRREWLNKYRIRFLRTPGASYQDTSFSFKTILHARRFVVINDLLYHYRIHGENSVSSSNSDDPIKNKIWAVMDEWNEILNNIKECNLLGDIGEKIYDLQYKTYKWNALRLSPKLARQFINKWSEEWKELSKQIPIKSTSLKNRILYSVIIHKPSLYVKYINRKRR